MDDPLAVRIPSLQDHCPAAPQSAAERAVIGNGERPPSGAAAAVPPPPAQGAARRRAVRGFNLLIWRGRLASEPEVLTAASGTRYLRIRCLQDQPDRNGQPSVQGIELALFNERAEQFAGFFRKGDEVLVKGRLSIEVKYDKQGVVRTTVSLHPDGPVELIYRA